MKIDFFVKIFKDSVEYPVKVDRGEFGVQDGMDRLPAHIVEDPSKRSACQCFVVNKTGSPLMFKPLDRLVEARDGTGKDVSMCDAMLYQENRHLCFLELKDSSKYADARKKGVRQLESTITIFNRNHPQQHFHHCLAVVANRRRPYFNMSNMVAMEDFKRKTGFILTFDAKIILN